MLSTDNEIFIHDIKGINGKYNKLSLFEIVKCEILFIAVPIREFENIIKSLEKLKKRI